MKFHYIEASMFWEMELKALTKHYFSNCEKIVKVSNSQWQWAGCVMTDGLYEVSLAQMPQGFRN